MMIYCLLLSTRFGKNALIALFNALYWKLAYSSIEPQLENKFSYISSLSGKWQSI